MIGYENKFHCLALKDNSFDTGKNYQQNFQSYLIQSKNEKYLIVHKKQCKWVDFKDIGETMGIVLLIKKRKEKIGLNKEIIANAGKLFSGFDEFSGKQYRYIPHFPLKNQESVNQIFGILQLPFELKKTEKGIIFQEETEQKNNIFSFGELQTPSDFLNFFFGLTIIYGKFEIKGEDLKNIKIHLPIFGQYLHYKEELNNIINKLQSEQYFFQKSENTQNGVLSYQISCNDGEILSLFSERMKKNWTISKKNLYQEAKNLLIQSFDYLDIENQEEILKLLEEKSLKILVK